MNECGRIEQKRRPKTDKTADNVYREIRLTKMKKMNFFTLMKSMEERKKMMERME